MRHATPIALLAALCGVTQAQAQAPAAEKLAVAYCQPGQGCDVCPTNYTHKQAIDLGVVREYHDGGSLVVWREAAAKWRSESVARATKEGLVQQFGATGAEGGVTFHANCAARPPLPGAIQPREGEWQVTSEASPMDGCAAPIRQLAEGATGTMRDRMRFPRPFLGEIPSVTPGMIQTGPNQFEGIAVEGAVHAWLYLVVRSEDEVLVSMSLVENGEIDPACDARVQQTFKRVGD
ncbi:hypothetical protein [Arenimonas sp.]|uniref:hypothetical protein n=1 Tax=Arenimonas sp. TaxID=1872635 RepID=UPI0025C5B239|nr:hypothetical protein [Arenimonas sp.]